MRTTKVQISLLICLDSIISLVSISEISSLYLASVAEQAGLSLTWLKTPKTGFLVTRFNKKWISLVSQCNLRSLLSNHMGRVKRIWYLSPMRAAKVQASLGIRAVSPEPPLLAHTSSESRGTFRLKARSLAPLNGWACAVKICNDGMREDTNSLDGAHTRENLSSGFATR